MKNEIDITQLVIVGLFFDQSDTNRTWGYKIDQSNTKYKVYSSDVYPVESHSQWKIVNVRDSFNDAINTVLLELFHVYHAHNNIKDRVKRFDINTVANLKEDLIIIVEGERPEKIDQYNFSKHCTTVLKLVDLLIYK